MKFNDTLLARVLRPVLALAPPPAEPRKYNPEFLEIGDDVSRSPVGSGKITGVTERGYPQVNHIAVSWLVRADGVQWNPHRLDFDKEQDDDA